MNVVRPALLGLALLASNVALADARSHKTVDGVPLAYLAPADEYFGPLKMSLLGIDNAMFNIVRRYAGGEMPDSTRSALEQVASAIRDWERHYPRDPGIGRALLRLHQTYARFPDERANRLAMSTASWILVKHPHCKQAKEARRLLALASARKFSAGSTLPLAEATPASNLPGVDPAYAAGAPGSHSR